jgi:hypothetical protein
MTGEQRAQVDTELLYAPDERRAAQALHAHDHPDGPEWLHADRSTRGQYLEKGAYHRLNELFGPPPA